MEKVSRSLVNEELRRQWVVQAVASAMRGNWDEAVQFNQQILRVFTDDTHARNRLAKAYTELGRHDEAAEAYEQSLKQQPSNNIARKRLAELYALLRREPAIPLGETMPSLELVEEEGEEIEDLEDYVEEEEAETATEDDTAE